MSHWWCNRTNFCADGAVTYHSDELKALNDSSNSIISEMLASGDFKGAKVWCTNPENTLHKFDLYIPTKRHKYSLEIVPHNHMLEVFRSHSMPRGSAFHATHSISMIIQLLVSLTETMYYILCRAAAYHSGKVHLLVSSHWWVWASPRLSASHEGAPPLSRQQDLQSLLPARAARARQLSFHGSLRLVMPLLMPLLLQRCSLSSLHHTSGMGDHVAIHITIPPPKDSL